MGFTEAEAVGQQFSVIFTPEDREAGVPGQELHQARLHHVGVLVFVHHDVAVPGAKGRQKLRVLQEHALQGEEHVVVVQQAVVALVVLVALGQLLQGRGVGQQLVGLA